METTDLVLVIVGFGGAVAAAVIGVRRLAYLWAGLREANLPDRVRTAIQIWQAAWVVTIVVLLGAVGVAGAVPSIGFDAVRAVLLPAFLILLGIMAWRVRTMSRWARDLRSERGLPARGRPSPLPRRRRR
ncbi:MAG TPA: hypothetical protein VIB62_03790 [Actinomycetota bacterium]